MSIKLNLRLKGGPGSGHRGHAGRPGQRGGSVTGAGGGAGGTSTPGTLSAATRFTLQYKKMGYKKGSTTQKTYTVVDERLDDHMGEGLRTNYMGSDLTTAGSIKKSIVNQLSEESELSREATNHALREWAESSNGTHGAMEMQTAVSEEFGVPLSSWQKSRFADMRRNPDDFPSHPLDAGVQSNRTMLRAMYDTTQRGLANAGYGPDDTVTLFRGIDTGKSGMSGSVSYRGNAMESWSVSPTVAMKYCSRSPTSYVLAARVPIRNILCTARTGFGCITEAEVVVFGSVPGSEAAIVYTGGNPTNKIIVNQ